MRAADIEKSNALALENKGAGGHAFRGFLEVSITGAAPFVMFNNDDDPVVKAYLSKGRDGFERRSLKTWVQLAKAPGVVWDVGAFSGVYSLAAIATHQDNRVLAFEPSGNTYHRLIQNVLANGWGAHIGSIPAALGRSPGRLPLVHPFGVYCLGSGESLVPGHHRSTWYTEDVEVLRGDDVPAVGKENPRKIIIETDPSLVRLIKIDVEGFEREVLAGMRDLLRRNKPAMIIECLGVQQFRDVQAELEPFGYRHRFIDDERDALHQDVDRFAARPSNILFHVGDSPV